MRGSAVSERESTVGPCSQCAIVYDVLVVGGGPAGAAAAYWLAERGRRVLVVEKKRFPREKTCGDGLTPRAVRQLHDMGLAEPLSEFQRYDGLRSIAHGVTLELRLARAPRLPELRLRRAPPRPRRDGRGPGGEGRGDPLARAPRRSSPSSRAASSPARSSSDRRPAHRERCGPGSWSSPTAPTPGSAGRSAPPATATIPLGMAIRGYFTSPYHDEPWIESHLDLRDRDGNHLPGYGWIFPVGDGTVNVGVGLLSTFTGWKSSTPPSSWTPSSPPHRPAGASRPRRPAARRPAASSRPADR